MNTSESPILTPSDEASPWAEECDLVLKGGITSGVVYPLAIVEISKAFRLRSIGGTSAGAIAAAAAAAAETGRQRSLAGTLGKDFGGGFQQLERLPAYLCELTPDGKHSRLLGFFKPKSTLSGLFDAFIGALGDEGGMARRISILINLVCASGAWPWIAGALALIPVWFLPLAWSSLLPMLSIGAFAAVVGLAVALLHIVNLILREVPANSFGICTGLDQGQGDRSGLALTDWLSSYLDELSGQSAVHGSKPLTFGDLREAEVDLQMMTTCLTLGRPFRLPFRNDEVVKENNSFWFKREDFSKLFPERIVNWMIANQRASAHESLVDAIDDFSFFRLPAPDDLPVVVAVRMSLSFPVLLSAVPLYAFDNRKSKETRTRERVWFTDGGVASNFPIHFFDAPVPSRPTFGLDLGNAEFDTEKGVSFPSTNNDARVLDWRRFPDSSNSQLLAFLMAIFSVAKDWNHDSLSRLPGFRDRIALIRLTAKQGGLNLNMPRERIEELTRYGQEAGKRFVRRFGKADKWAKDIAQLEPKPVSLDWQNHQMIRFRLLLATLSELLLQMERVLRKTEGTSSDYHRFLGSKAPASSYRIEGVGAVPSSGKPETQADLARYVLRELRDVALALQGEENATKVQGKDISLSKGAPKPTPELKVRPRV